MLLSGVRGEGDIEGIPDVHIECKRQERMRLTEWFTKEIVKAGNKPMAVIHRPNRSPFTFVTMTIEDWSELFREAIMTEQGIASAPHRKASEQ